MSARAAVSYKHVGVALSLLLIDVAVSALLRLGLTRSLIVAALRAVVQLSLLGLVLESVLKSHSPWLVAGTTALMLLFGSNEMAFVRVKRRPQRLFLSSTVSLICAVVPITVIATKYALVHDPWWQADAFIPVLGMITGNAVSSSAICVNYITNSVSNNRDHIETYLAHGASRFEAALPVAREALGHALLSAITQMSITGLIQIPGMMTGAILGGQPINEAAKMQMIISFCITATSISCTLLVAVFTFASLIDEGFFAAAGDSCDACEKTTRPVCLLCPARATERSMAKVQPAELCD